MECSNVSHLFVYRRLLIYVENVIKCDEEFHDSVMNYQRSNFTLTLHSLYTVNYYDMNLSSLFGILIYIPGESHCFGVNNVMWKSHKWSNHVKSLLIYGSEQNIISQCQRESLSLCLCLHPSLFHIFECCHTKEKRTFPKKFDGMHVKNQVHYHYYLVLTK